MVSTGFGDTDASVILGGLGSYLTVLVMVVVCPALSLVIIVILLLPTVFNVTSLLNFPSAATVAASPLIVTVTGDDVISFVTPDTVIVCLFVTYPSIGLSTLSDGGVVSILNVVLT